MVQGQHHDSELTHACALQEPGNSQSQLVFGERCHCSLEGEDLTGHLLGTGATFPIACPVPQFVRAGMCFGTAIPYLTSGKVCENGRCSVSCSRWSEVYQSLSRLGDFSTFPALSIHIQRRFALSIYSHPALALAWLIFRTSKEYSLAMRISEPPTNLVASLGHS